MVYVIKMVFEKMYAVFLVVMLQFLECNFQGNRSQSSTLLRNNDNTERQINLNKSVNLENDKGPTDFEHENLRRNFIKAKLRSEIDNTTSNDANKTYIRSSTNKNYGEPTDEYHGLAKRNNIRRHKGITYENKNIFDEIMSLLNKIILSEKNRETETMKGNNTNIYIEHFVNKGIIGTIASVIKAFEEVVHPGGLGDKNSGANDDTVPKAIKAEERNGEEKNIEHYPHEAVPEKGFRSRDGGRRIVGGKDVDISLYPYHAAYGANCAGSIIDSKWILTVAHCEEKPYVRTGSTYLSKGKQTHVKHYFPHPGWGHKNKAHPFDFDFQLLELAEHLSFDLNTQPIKIAKIEHMVVGTMITVTGWGNMEEDNLIMVRTITCYIGECDITDVTGWRNMGEDGAYSNVLRAVRIPIVAKDVCQRVPYPYFRGQLTDRMFCGGYVEAGKDACQGDSGGPATSGERLMGMVSFGYGCATPGSYGVYSQVVIVRDWIEMVTGLRLN